MIINFKYNNDILSRVIYFTDKYSYIKIEEYKTFNKKTYKRRESCYKDGLYHAVNKPAYKLFDENGILIYECYYNKGKIHNSVGPAKIYSGKYFNSYYYLNDVHIKKSSFLNLLESKLNDN